MSTHDHASRLGTQDERGIATHPAANTHPTHVWTCPSTTVLTALEVVGRAGGPALPPLYDAIDPDALDALFAPQPDGSPRPIGQVCFQIAGYEVTVWSDGAIRLRSLSE